MAVSTAIVSVSDVESFIREYYDAWSGTDLDRIVSYYADDIVLQIPGSLMEGKEAVRDRFVRPLITAFPGNHHSVKNMIFGPGVVTVEFSFEAQHKGPFAGHAATGARIKLPGCGAYEYDSAKRQITAGRIYFDVGTLLQTITDSLADDREESVEALRESALNLSLITNVIPTFIHVLRTDGSVQYVNQAVMDYHGLTLEEVRKEDYRARVIHPEDVERLRKERRDALTRPVPFEYEQRVLSKDGRYRWFLFRFNPLLDEKGRIERWYSSAFDIEDRKRAEEALVRHARVRADVSEAFSKPNHLREILRGCTEAIVRHLDAAFARIWLLNKDESMLELQASAGMYTRLDGSYSRIPLGDLKVGWIAREKKAHLTNDFVNDPRVHNKSWAKDNGIIAFAGYPLIVEDRLIGVVALFARRTLEESILDTLASVADTIAQGIVRMRAEQSLRNSERNMSMIVNTIPTFAWSARPDGSGEFLNQRWLDYTGMAAEEASGWGWMEAIHPDDRHDVADFWQACVASGAAGETEARMRRFDSAYRWFLFRVNPLRDESGKIIKWYGTNLDIEDRKQAEERLRNENVVLREEIVNTSMFEEIVGTSAALQGVLAKIAKVAPTESTVLITGETGTGKELIARAIHKNSQRAELAFVGLNCAAIPRELIGSELFGHEKGAFTGATQQRLGRFELANGGTLFLDEVGELPAETQIALLRVLQEREFERVGGTRRIHADVRVIAATNRDLQAAIQAGSFRSDLFYRLNVFPIEIPPLRERCEDIRLLVDYFIDRYARNAGKNITSVNKKTLELLQSYRWPGNIRELQNVIERSIILCETEVFSIEKSWLPQQAFVAETRNQTGLSGTLLTQEKDMIEAALRESRGQVFGPSGAAARLGVKRTTLESKIKALKIDKKRFKDFNPS